MIYKLQDGDIIKIIPILNRDDTIVHVKPINCMFLENRMIYDTSGKNYLRKIWYSNRKSSKSSSSISMKYFICAYVNGLIKFISVGRTIMDIISKSSDRDIKGNKFLLVRVKMVNCDNGLVLPNYEDSSIIEREWIKPVNDVNNNSEWIDWIKNNQPEYLDDLLERSSIFNHISKIKKAFGENILSDLISDARDKKIETILNK